MQNLKDYLNRRLKFLYDITDKDDAGNNISTLSQIHEIKVILNWIDDHENADAEETPADAHTNTPKSYADGVKDAYNDVLHMIYADGYDADAIAKALENPKEA